MSFTSTPQSTPKVSTKWLNVKVAAILTGLFVALIWVLEALDYALPIDLDQWGIRSWSITGIFPGFIMAPVLHADFDHLIGNTVPVMVLGFLAAMRGLRHFFTATALIILIGGLGVWLLSSPGVLTVGASGMIFGYFGYLVGRGILSRRGWDIVIAVAVIILYGSIIWGIFPSDPFISWQGHLFGFIGGLAAAWILRKKYRKPADEVAG
ncbi:rhomboid family intramembrane serine protease [Stackebrandtia nassauensis]|uniref:Rhomboid family protein n=1 Tax=Stackebrandtia nassauensis (strain DSM 44728 / CIP 108903 / NRRL B-16338 / NBRC 102104 / LLR-40K-21) TaxID=446470 RepID=D3Q268_STANL|nr:rhomboid family intramembrane serine protease [Stackebrandtia nassauensis]ADD41935.1 Rhomboid family protein [Stackebrandtia nassauensis DSM 44728]